MKKETDKRPWGGFEQFTHNETSTVKILTIEPSESLSLQYHTQRMEFWRVLTGVGMFTVGDTIREGKEGDEFYIEKGVKHRINNNGLERLRVLEIAFGEYHENDIVRIDDKYNRI